jgi:hypothetical protein
MERKNNYSKSLDAINIDRRATGGRKNVMKTIQSNQGTIASLVCSAWFRSSLPTKRLAGCQYDMKYHMRFGNASKEV